MTNREIIENRFEAFLHRVHEAGNRALCEQMEDTLHKSLNLHEQLESGYHAHHLTESDSHGWAVADRGVIVASGASVLSEPNEYGSAEDCASKLAVADNPGQKGVFSSVLANPFAGNAEHGGDEAPSTNPHDSVRFETKLQELLMVNARANLPWLFRKNIKAVAQK